MEIRLHGRGGQGGVTCAKILAAVYSRLGKSVQTFGDYAGERSGAPVRAYTRVSDGTISNRNKVYHPDHLLVLDSTLLVTTGLAVGGSLILNSPEPLETFSEELHPFLLGVVDATAIARKNGIGTRSLVIVNTTIAGAYLKVQGLPFELLEATYEHLGFLSNLPAAREAYETVQIRAPLSEKAPAEPIPFAKSKPVPPLTEHKLGMPTSIRTGSWRSQTPRYTKKPAPCLAWCPAGNDVLGFLQALVKGGEAAAAAVLGETTPLAGVCGRVCPAPCMEGCNRAELDGAVNIRALERWVADHAPVALPKPEPIQNPRRFAIVGGGPAGLSAAYQLARRGHEVVILEGQAKLGGVLRTGIPSFRLPRGALNAELEGILALGVEARCGEFLDRAAIESLLEDFDGLILATGLQHLRAPKIPGIDLGGVEQGIGVLSRLNAGGELKLSGKVAVLGGGNTAMDCARSALRSGAEEVTVFYRRTRAEMPAIGEEIEQAQEEGVRFAFQRQPISFHGSGRLQEIELAEVEMGALDSTGRRRPVVTERTERLPCDFALLALGQSADFSLLPEGWEILDGLVHRAGEALFCVAAGDLATGHGTVAHAIGDGTRAALRMLGAMGLGSDTWERAAKEDAVAATDIRFDHFAPATPAREGFVPVEARVSSFAEVDRGLASSLEAHRCFSCGDCTRCDTCLIYCPEGIIRRETGSYEVDYSYCKGCGICVSECPRKAMEMTGG